MAEPATTALAAKTLFEIGSTAVTVGDAMALAGAAGAAVGGAAAIGQGRLAGKAAEINAARAEEEAAHERAAASRRAQDFAIRQSARRAAVRAGRVASGVADMTGTPLLVDRAIGTRIERAIDDILVGGEARARRLDDEAVLARTRGRSASRAGFIRAGTTLLSTAGTFA